MREADLMAIRNWPGLGPVFASEWLTVSRRWQGYALRSLLVLLLLLGLSAVWLERYDGAEELTIWKQAEIGRQFYTVTTIILLGLVSLAAPAATAGAICLDKARGNLMLLFSTDLTDAEIVLGKLAARLVPVLGLIACAAPVLALATLFGGVDPVLVTGAILVCLACAVFGCTLALTLSVWGRKTHEVLLATYAFGILWLLSAPIWAGLVAMLPWWARPAWLPSHVALLPYNPVFLVIAPIDGLPGMGPIGLEEQAWFCTLGLLTSALLAAAATWRIRAVVIRQAGQGGRDAPGGLPDLGPPRPARPGSPACCPRRHSTATRYSGASGIDGGRRAGRSPSGASSACSRVCSASGRSSRRSTTAGWRAATGRGDQRRAGIGRAAALEHRVGDEPCRGPPARQPRLAAGHAAIDPVDRPGQVVGAFRGVPPLMMWPVLIAAVLATHTGFAIAPALIGGLVVAYGAAITSLGLALATWLPRMGRAIGLTAGLYLVVLIGAVPAGMILFGRGPSGAGPGIAAASPFWGVGFSSALFGGTGGPRQQVGPQAAWLVFWIVAYGLVAFSLLLATLKTFNRCLGRLDDWSFREEIFQRLARKPATWYPRREDKPELDLQPRRPLPLASDQ